MAGRYVDLKSLKTRYMLRFPDSKVGIALKTVADTVDYAEFLRIAKILVEIADSEGGGMK